MARYNIELRTESRVSETLQVEKADLTELRIEVARFVGDLLKDHANQIWIDEDWRVDVTDQTGLILYVMQITATNSAATAPLRR
ncbi:DUF6894 family protein [Sphingosinicella humi]|uniref:DUF6894 domain-containing protein n=1 Tax=Allosphingosinicella humi TaxID=2068657 RepID=A0A2U2J3E1_9SPHN|nr:hypothetical protein [Sphingosinicella humi]PWG02847.1 hypothetical protein DF286_08175 [Sphingosinicella humi]